MKRKIIRQGHSTLTVTIPSKWAKRYGVKPGDEVEVTEQEKAIIIRTETGPGNDTSFITVDISGLPPRIIWRYILSTYRAGYDEISITGIEGSEKGLYSAFSYNTIDYLQKEDGGIELSPMEVVQAAANRLIGMAIIDQKPHFCILKDLGETTDKEFDNAVRRIFLLLQNETEIIEKGLGNDRQGLKSMHIIDTNLDRFEDFCLRILNKTGYKEFRKTPVIFSTIFILEMIGDELKKIASHILDSGKKPYSREIKELFRIQQAQMNRFYKLFYKFSKEGAKEIYEIDRQGTEFNQKLDNKLSNEERELLHHFKKIGINITSLAELRIDMEF